jgi:N-formylglutamate amidohydrolase
MPPFDLTHPQSSPLFDFYSPRAPYAGILSIPHSGEQIPADFEEFLHKDPIRRAQDVDFRVHELIDIEQLRDSGIGVLKAHIHRICVDLNRSPELCVLNWKKNSKGLELVEKEPNQKLSLQLRDKYYAPYYSLLSSLIQEGQNLTPRPVSFVDLHSMPSRPTSYHLAKNPNQAMERPDFCLSDRHGKTCEPAYIESIHQDLAKRGYQVNINDPYIGGYVTEYVDGFRTNNIQIEIKREIYMDEESQTLVPSKVNQLRPNLTEALINLFSTFSDRD